MEIFPRAACRENEGNLRNLTFFRLVVATVVIGAAIMVLQIDDRALSVVVLYGLLGVIYLSTGLVYIAFSTGVSFRPLLWLQIYIDIVVLTMIVHYSGGSASYFSILYILPIIMGGTYFQVTGGLATALLASGAYIIYVVLEFSGHLQVPPIGWVHSKVGVYRPLVHGYLNIVVFFFTGALSGYLSKHLRHTGEELADREAELKSVQLSTDNILQNMSSGLIVTNMSGEIMIVNPAAESILGLEYGGSYKGEPIGDVIPHMPTLVQEFASVLEGGEPRRRYELEVRRHDGGILPLGISISILKGEREEKRGLIALFQDLTEVQRMRSRVRMADKMAAIGKLSAAIAHEIRAPLASICGSIEMLSGELDVSGDNRKLMYLILKESDRLERIITDFLEFARMRQPTLSALDIERCLEETLLLLKQSPAIEEKLSMRLECDVTCARVYADGEQIKQVFLNLGLNACEAMCRSGSLTISIIREKQQLREETAPVECIRVRFENDGPHIPEDVLPHIFEPFFTTKEGGTGLGLAIAARIVESHGGTIRAENIGSRGTAFTVIIPAAVPNEKEKEKVFQEGFIGF